MNGYKQENEKRTSMNNYMLNYEENKYIDKGSLTSRECGRLVKGMVEDYERKYKY